MSQDARQKLRWMVALQVSRLVCFQRVGRGMRAAERIALKAVNEIPHPRNLLRGAPERVGRSIEIRSSSVR